MTVSTIAVAAQEMEGDRTGVGRYLEGLLQGLAELDGEVELRLFFKGHPFSHPLFNDPRFVPIFDHRPRAHPIVWEQTRLPALLRRQELDLLFFPAYSLPLIGLPPLPTVLTVHDLSFEHRGGEFGLKERWRRRFLARRGARRASRVLVDADEIADEIAVFYGIPRQRIGVVPLGIEAKFRSDAEPSPDRQQNDLDLLAAAGMAPPYLLHLGAILPRRHVDLVIAAFAAAAAGRPDLRLVLAGPDRLRHAGELERLIDGSGVAERIVRPGYVEEPVLPALYRQAELLFYLSDYEGYGLPPLESLAAGTPAIVGHAPGLAGLWPEYPYRCQTLDRAAVLAMVERGLGDETERRRVVAEGRHLAASLTWRRSAELFLAEIDRAIATERER